MVDILGLMKKAQAMQARMKDVQDELERTEVEGESGGGMVKVRLNAKGQMKAIALDPSLMNPADKEMAEDLILAAHTDAKAKADRLAEEKMQEVAAGLPLPPGMKLPF
jgi:DNA-binding YbaB/EbfC family protein